MKYNNHRIKNSDGEFDSKLEYARWVFLKGKERDGEITDLKRQVAFELLPAQYETKIIHLKTKDKEVRSIVERPCFYIADFTYMREGRLVVEDTKGAGKGRFLCDQKFPIKKKMMYYFHHIKINVVTKSLFWDND